jgi:hypothetical protein
VKVVNTVTLIQTIRIFTLDQLISAATEYAAIVLTK